MTPWICSAWRGVCLNLKTARGDRELAPCAYLGRSDRRIVALRLLRSTVLRCGAGAGGMLACRTRDGRERATTQSSKSAGGSAGRGDIFPSILASGVVAKGRGPPPAGARQVLREGLRSSLNRVTLAQAAYAALDSWQTPPKALRSLPHRPKPRLPQARELRTCGCKMATWLTHTWAWPWLTKWASSPKW